MPDNIIPIKISDFSGGQVSNVSDRYLRDNELIKAYDVRVDRRGVLETRYPWSGHSVNQIQMSQVHGIHTFYDRDGREWLFLFGRNANNDGSVMRGITARQCEHDSGDWFPPVFSGSGVFSWLYSYDFNETTEPITTYMPRSFCTYQGDLVMSNSIYGGVRIIRIDHPTIDEDGCTLENSRGIQKFYWPIMAHVVATYQNRLVLANTQMGPNFMHWSAPEMQLNDRYNNPAVTVQYDPAYDIFNPNADEAPNMAGAGYRNVYPADGDAIVAMSGWGGKLGIFREHSLLVGYGEDMVVEKVHKGFGTSSQHAVATTPWGWAFIDSEGKGVFLWDGSANKPVKISTPLDDEWQYLDTSAPMKLGTKLWDSETGFEEFDDAGAGFSNMDWSMTNAGIYQTRGGLGRWTSNVMTTEESAALWLNVHLDITASTHDQEITVYARSGNTKVACEAAAFASLGTIYGDDTLKWFNAVPSILIGTDRSRRTIAASITDKFIQIRIEITNATSSPYVNRVRLNYTHGNTTDASVGRWPSIFWDGNLLWVNAAVKNENVPYVTRTYVWSGATMGEGGTAYGSWMRWKNAAPSCMTRFNRRIVWGVSNYQYNTSQLHILRYTDKDCERDYEIYQISAGKHDEPLYIPLTSSPAVLPHAESKFYDGGLPHIKKRLHKVVLAWKDDYTLNSVVVRITTQKYPQGIYAGGVKTGVNYSPAPKKLCFTVPMNGTKLDRVWIKGLGMTPIATIDMDNNAWIGAGGSTEATEYTTGYAFKVELLPNWGQGYYSDELIRNGEASVDYTNTQFKIYELYLEVEPLGETPMEMPHDE